MGNKHLDRIKRGFGKCIEDPSYADKYFFCRLFGFSQQEFNCYHFEEGFWRRFSFVSSKRGKQIFNECNRTLTDKRDNYLLLGEYYMRECCLLEDNLPEADKTQLLFSFAERHKQFIAKSFTGAGGTGVRKYESRKDPLWAREFLTQYPSGCLLEEPIQQTPDVAAVHPWSVNTLRVTTVNYGNRIEAIYPVMRFGTGRRATDNDGAGLLCAIDQRTAAVISAFDLKGESYTAHPDTGLPIIGFPVPELNSALDLARKLATYFPDNVFTGFDFAYTEHGWILVEANTETAFMIWQLPYQQGFKKELRKIEHKTREALAIAEIHNG